MITAPPPEGAALDEAIRPIRRAVLDRTVHRRRRRSRWTFGAVGSVAAVTALATVIVGGNLTGTTDRVPVVGSHPQAATAAEVLHKAADETVLASDPTVGPGQYLEVSTKRESQGFFGDANEYSALVPYTVTVYRPADVSAEWTLVRTSGEPTRFFPAASATEAAAEWKREGSPYPTETLHGAGGRFEGYSDWTPAHLAEMPRDPDELYTWVSEHATGSVSHEEAMTTLISDDLATGLVPADLRSAMYEVLAKIPGTTITHDAVTLDGRTGTAIGRDEPNRDGEHSEIVIDPDTGAYLGSRTLTGSASRVLPKGAVLDSSAVTTSVVDSVPAN